MAVLMASPATASAIEVPVFVNTSLGTHIVVSVSPDLTAEEFKRKFEIMHSNHYPQIGNIKVNGLMIKKMSHLYHLPESMPIKHVFHGSDNASFLHVEACPLNTNIPPPPETRTETNCEKPRKKPKVTDFPPSSLEQTSERMSEQISVSGIIKKYFSVYDDEVTSSNSKPIYAPKTPPTSTKANGSRGKVSVRKVNGSRYKKKVCAIGNRLIVAANKLGVSSSDKKPVVSLCKHKCDEFSMMKVKSCLRHPVFEIGEE